MEYNKAKVIAEKWIDLLSPACERIEIAGSIRRGKPDIKDIDLVAIPRMQVEPDLFGGDGTTINLLAVLVRKLFYEHAYIATIQDGPKKKKMQLIEGLRLELNMVTPPAEWGVIFLIRTGPEDFGHFCVTPKSKGGALPSYLRVKDGAVWNRTRKIKTPEEADFFHLLGMEYIEPGERRAQWRVFA